MPLYYETRCVQITWTYVSKILPGRNICFISNGYFSWLTNDASFLGLVLPDLRLRRVNYLKVTEVRRNLFNLVLLNYVVGCLGIVLIL